MSSKSKYAQKRDSGQMMYGPGCCAHSVTDAQIKVMRDRAQKERAAHEASRRIAAILADDLYSQRMRRSREWEAA